MQKAARQVIPPDGFGVAVMATVQRVEGGRYGHHGHTFALSGHLHHTGALVQAVGTSVIENWRPCSTNSVGGGGNPTCGAIHCPAIVP